MEAIDHACLHPGSRKNLFDTTLSSGSTGSQSAEAHHPQLKAKTSTPISITAAPLRRQSEVSQFSANSNDGGSQACMPDGGGLESHVPHMICKCYLFRRLLAATKPHASQQKPCWAQPHPESAPRVFTCQKCQKRQKRCAGPISAWVNQILGNRPSTKQS